MEPLTAEAAKLVRTISSDAAKQYERWADFDDIHQEVYVYYCTHQKQLEKWRDNDDAFRLKRALYGAAKQYCEREKAAKSGYEFEDLFWYEPVMLASLMPLVLNSGWDGLSGEDADPGQPRGKTVASEGGSLLAMVCDIRRFIQPSHRSWNWDVDTELGRRNLERLSRRLGGPFPYAPGYHPGQRREYVEDVLKRVEFTAGEEAA